MKRNLIVIQDGCMECGAACLLSIIRYYKGNSPMSKILELTSTTKTGTSFYNIKKASDYIGLEATGYYVDEFSKIREHNIPILCQIKENNYEHFIVIYKISKNKVELMDPAYGVKIITIKEFVSLWTGYIMTFKKLKKLPVLETNNHITKLLLQIIKKNKTLISFIILISISISILILINSLVIEYIIDNITTIPSSNLILVAISLSIIQLIKILSNYLRNTLLIKLNIKIDYPLILNTFQKILLLPYNYYKNKTTGDLVSRINDLAYLKNILNKIIITIFLDIIVVLICSIIILILNKKMFVILIIIIIFYLLLLNLFRPLYKKLIDKNRINNSLLNNQLIESLEGFETIKNLNLESITYNRFKNIYNKSIDNDKRLNNLYNLENLMKELIKLLGIISVNLLCLKLINLNIITIGNLVFYNTLFIHFLTPINNIIELNKEYYLSKNIITRINNIFEVQEEDLIKDSNLIIENSISIKKLSFSYNEDLVLNNISLNIKPLDKVLIIGNSGSGKSTIFKILYKYYESPKNRILFNNNDINNLSLKKIRNNISLISQNEYLFTDTIKNNIIMDRNIRESEFNTVCKLTEVDKFVSILDNCYETRLEENGHNISGGERQRIILARALLKESKIILIDEGLNELDINLERRILKNIFNYYKDKTFIIISHRLENMDLYNKVIKIQNGNILDILEKKN